MFAVDTNILVYAHYEGYPQHRRARAFVEEHLTGEHDWCLGWQVVYEYLRIVTHPRVHRTPLTLGEALADLERYLRSPRCHLLAQTRQHRQAVKLLARENPGISGNLVHDLHYAALLMEHSIEKLFTADADFRRFAFLTVIDPTS